MKWLWCLLIVAVVDVPACCKGTIVVNSRIGVVAVVHDVVIAVQDCT